MARTKYLSLNQRIKNLSEAIPKYKEWGYSKEVLNRLENELRELKEEKARDDAKKKAFYDKLKESDKNDEV